MSFQELRQHPRHASSRLLLVNTRDNEGNEHNLKCPCRDVSGGGLSFLCARPVTLEIGQRIQIAMTADDPAASVNLGKGTIVWVQDDDDEPPWAGVMMDALLDEHHMKQLLENTI